MLYQIFIHHMQSCLLTKLGFENPHCSGKVLTMSLFSLSYNLQDVNNCISFLTTYSAAGNLYGMFQTEDYCLIVFLLSYE